MELFWFDGLHARNGRGPSMDIGGGVKQDIGRMASAHSNRGDVPRNVTQASDQQGWWAPWGSNPQPTN